MAKNILTTVDPLILKTGISAHALGDNKPRPRFRNLSVREIGQLRLVTVFVLLFHI